MTDNQVQFNRHPVVFVPHKGTHPKRVKILNDPRQVQVGV